MTQFCSFHRTPRAGIDRIDGARPALAVVELALTVPAVAETIVLVLDPEHRGRTIVIVDGTDDPDAVVDICERLAVAATNDTPGALVVASVRPGEGLLPGDDDRWLEASDITEGAGVELLEWFVIGSQVCCPRDLLGEPPRWRR